MLVLKYSDIPSYLHESAFYQSLNDEDENGRITIPKKCFAPQDTVQNLENFAQLLRVMLFWGIDKLPRATMEYCSLNPLFLWESVAVNVLGEESKLLTDLLFVFSESRENQVVRAIKTGRIELVEYLISTTKPVGYVGTRETTVAARMGNIDCLRLLCAHDYNWSVNACTEAAAGGHLDCLMFAHRNYCQWDENVYLRAARNGHLPCIQYAHQQGLPWSAEVCIQATEGGHLYILQYLHQQRCPWNDEVVYQAAYGGHKECLRYALQHHCPIPTDACTAACRSGYFECLRLLHDYHAPWDAHTCAAASGGGYLVCLQYLYEHHCEWSSSTTTAAARGGHLTTLRYAIIHGCAYDDAVLLCAVQAGSLPCMQYLVEECGISIDSDGVMFGEAFVRAHFNCVRYIIDHSNSYRDYVFNTEQYVKLHHCLSVTTYNMDEQLCKCVAYATQRGWKWSAYFVSFVHNSDLKRCKAFVLSQGWMADADM